MHGFRCICFSATDGNDFINQLKCFDRRRLVKPLHGHVNPPAVLHAAPHAKADLSFILMGSVTAICQWHGIADQLDPDETAQFCRWTNYSRRCRESGLAASQERSRADWHPLGRSASYESEIPRRRRDIPTCQDSPAVAGAASMDCAGHDPLPSAVRE